MDAVPPPVPPSAADRIGEPIVQTHEHSDPTLHNASYGMRLVGHSYAHPNGTIPEGVGYTEFAWNDGWVYLCRAGAEGGFVILDARDPARPAPVAAIDGLGCFDVKASRDNTLVFWAQQRQPVNDTSKVVGGPDYAPRGAFVVDVSDKAAPRTVGFLPLPPNGVHTLRYYCMEDAEPAEPTAPCAGRELLFLQTYDLHEEPLALRELKPVGSVLEPLAPHNPATQKLVILDVVRTASGVELRPVGQIQEQPGAVSRKFRPHDSFPTWREDVGHVLYVSYWDYGVLLYDINDPAGPRLLSRFDDFIPSPHVATHFAMPQKEPIGNRTILVAEPELEVAADAGQWTLVDYTDPAAPLKVGWWSLPGLVFIDSPFRFSPHNFNVVNDRIYAAHYHAGIWVVDIRDPEEPASAGFYLPHMPRPGFAGDIPDVFSARQHDGLVYASDSATGLYILHYEKDPWPSGAYVASTWTPPP